MPFLLRKIAVLELCQPNWLTENEFMFPSTFLQGCRMLNIQENLCGEGFILVKTL